MYIQSTLHTVYAYFFCAARFYSLLVAVIVGVLLAMVSYMMLFVLFFKNHNNANIIIMKYNQIYMYIFLMLYTEIAHAQCMHIHRLYIVRNIRRCYKIKFYGLSISSREKSLF